MLDAKRVAVVSALGFSLKDVEKSEIGVCLVSAPILLGLMNFFQRMVPSVLAVLWSLLI